jgi:anti-sigma regulatory factor (Ser/Thr protein kinase)
LVGGSNVEQALDLELPAIPDSCPRIRHAVRATLDRTGVDIGAVDLAVSEAVTNVVVHAYRDRDPTAPPGTVRVAVALEATAVRVAVIDRGVGLRPRPDSPGLGFGLALMAHTCDELEIEQRADGTRVQMRFAFGG